jgi:hypothetical protein
MRGSDPEANTEELDTRFLDTIEFHNREFHQYSIEHNVCFEPIDEDQIEQLNLQHEVFMKTFDNRLIFPPLNNPRRVLDLGYGTGSWAVEVAERYPACEVSSFTVLSRSARYRSLGVSPP